ncbi:UNVERIFIED_CONTAM: hypothetical protein Slati_2641700 [Sesamum latifolium]|uniref:Retrotransposon gag domain-containing protein n=1 Tax=Sesamum latifolium TaxID=2727402 RepID=A0AAW2VTL9_9LAMI
MRPQGVTEEQVKLRAFPFYLGEKAKDWLYSLPSGSIISWNELKKQFLENYFPASRTITIRKEIKGIRQFFGENFHEYCGRFKHLVESCRHHQIFDHLLIQYLYEGLFETNRSLVDAASGGALYDKTPTETRKLITIMAANNQQFGNRNDNPPRKDTRTCIQNLESHTRTSIRNLENQTRASIQNLESQVSQLASSISRFESQGKLPSQTIINPKKNISAITVCSEEELQLKNNTRRGHAQQNRTENSVVRGHAEQGKIGEELENSPKQAEKFNQVGEEHPKVLVPKPPFSERFAKSKKEEEEKEILETLRKVEKMLCDLGASINVMPLAIYESLNVGLLTETGVVLQLTDRSIVYPEGVLEDVLVQVNELVFPADFYVLDMADDNSPNFTSILLRRPFLKTSKTKIDVDAEILSMEFDNEVMSFNIGGVIQNSNGMHSVFLMDFIDPLVQENAMFDNRGTFKMTINKNLTSSPRTYKNKVFHEKISSRKKSSMDHQVLLNPHYHRVHYIEEVDLERPTHLS